MGHGPHLGEGRLQRRQVLELDPSRFLPASWPESRKKSRSFFARRLAAAVVGDDPLVTYFLVVGAVSASSLVGRSFRISSFFRSSATPFGFGVISRDTRSSSSTRMFTAAEILSRKALWRTATRCWPSPGPWGGTRNLPGAFSVHAASGS